MTSKILIPAVMAMVLASGGFALAQGSGDRNDHGRQDQQAPRGGQPDEHSNNGRQPDEHSNNGRQPDRRDEQFRANNSRNNNDAHPDERGAGPDHEFRRGQRLPAEYRHRQYVVDDWRGHHLSAPPRGYHWVQTGGDYVLVAISTGIILQLLLGN